jgi:Fe-S oxidoreductase
MPDFETSLTYCTFCPKLCRHTCPVSNAEARETLTPQTKMAQLRRLRLREVERNVVETEAIYGCTGCGACTDFCLHGVETGPALFRGRDEAEREGRGHPALRDLPQRFDEHSRAATEKVRAVTPTERRPLEAQVAFMPGCESPEIAPRMLALADRIGAEYLAITETSHGCGGYPLLAAGQFDAFRLHAERMADELKGYARVVVHCPACAWAMKTQYRAFGVPLQSHVEHTVEFLESFVERLPIKTRQGAAFYHDPCYLGRHQQLYDGPRRLAAKAFDEVREFSRNRNQAECSGGGGLLPETMPKTADAISDHRLVEVKESEVRRIVTGCATCKKRLSRDDVTALDLVEALEAATR